MELLVEVEGSAPLSIRTRNPIESPANSDGIPIMRPEKTALPPRYSVYRLAVGRMMNIVN